MSRCEEIFEALLGGNACDLKPRSRMEAYLLALYEKMEEGGGSGGSNLPLTLTGAVEATYDGSKAVSVEIPAGGGGTPNMTLLQSADIAGVAEVIATSETPLNNLLIIVKGAKNKSGGSQLGVAINGKQTGVGFTFGKDGTGAKYGYATFKYNGAMWECYKGPESSNDNSITTYGVIMPYYHSGLFSGAATRIRVYVGSTADDYLPTGGTIEIYGG